MRKTLLLVLTGPLAIAILAKLNMSDGVRRYGPGFAALAEAVGHRREDVGQHAGAGEGLEVPELGPGPGVLRGGERLRVVADRAAAGAGAGDAPKSTFGGFEISFSFSTVNCGFSLKPKIIAVMPMRTSRYRLML